MYLESLFLRNFRNYRETRVEFHPRFNFIFGKNAQGKTNLLEAIYYLGNLKSFRTVHLCDLINSLSQEGQLAGKIIKEDLRWEAEIRFDLSQGPSPRREVLLNGKKPSLFGEYYRLLPIILFEPWEVYLFRHTPRARRHFLDRALFLDNPLRLSTLRNYEVVVSQKNRYLKETRLANGQEEVWDEQLCNLGAKILFWRLEWISRMNDLLGEEYQKISQTDEKVVIDYRSDVVMHAFSEEALKKVLKGRLDEKKGEEKIRRESLVGPHRDDWTVLIDHKEIGALGSQGENRSVVIAVKQAQIRLLQKSLGISPLFLLDDVGSELDSSRGNALFLSLAEKGGQVFVTTTESSKILNSYSHSQASFLVEEGGVRMLV